MISHVSGKVPIQHRRRGHERGYVARSLTDHGTLVSAKEKKFVLLDRSTDHSPVLIALQMIASVCEGVFAIQIAIAEELERVTVQRIGAGFGDPADRCPGMYSGLSSQCARLHLELLQRVRERQRHPSTI